MRKITVTAGTKTDFSGFFFFFGIIFPACKTVSERTESAMSF